MAQQTGSRSRVREAVRAPRHALRVLWWLAKGYWYKISYPIRGIRFHAGRNFRIQGKLVVRGPGRVVFGDNVIVGGVTTPWTYDANAVIKVGDSTFLNGTRFGVARLVDIGPRCMIADTQILDTDFHSIRADRHHPAAPIRVAPVVIEENVWIAADCGVLPGTIIGRNSVVGFGSVCTGAYPPDSLIVGNRAKVVGPLPRADVGQVDVAAERAARAVPAPRPIVRPRPRLASSGSTALTALNAFRGFAVMNLVLVHALPLYLLVLRDRYGASYSYPIFQQVWSLLFYGSTIYFAVTLGVLFSAHLAEHRWRSYFRAQLLLVLLPYALLSLLFTAFAWDFQHGLVLTATDDLWRRWMINTLTGQAVFTYWYVPVLLTLAALTPILAWLARHPQRRWALAVLALLPLLVSRTGRTFTPETIIYFAGAYSVGLWFGVAFEQNMGLLNRLRIPVLTLTVLSSLALLLLPQSVEWVRGTSVRESLFYIQKLSASGLAILVFQRVASALPHLLDALSRHAYAVYLLHFVFFQLLIGGAAHLLPSPDLPLVIGVALLIAVFAVAASLAATWSLQRLLGSYSRTVLGI